MDNQGQKQTQDLTKQSVGVNPNTVSPSVSREVERPVSDYLTHSETLPHLDKELKEAGVETVSERPNLTPEHEEIGVKQSLENNVPKIDQGPKVNFPMTNDQINSAASSKQASASAYWLAVLLKKIKKKLFK